MKMLPTIKMLRNGYRHTDGDCSLWMENGVFHVAKTFEGENACWVSYSRIGEARIAFTYLLKGVMML